MKITFILSNPQNHIKEDELVVSPIYLICRYGNRRTKIRTKESVLPSHWEPTTYRLISRAPDKKRINNVLNELQILTEQTFDSFINENNRPPAPKELKSLVEETYFSPKEVIHQEDTFFGFIDWYIDFKQRKNEVSKGRIYKYKSAKKKLINFQEETGYILTFNRINENFSIKYQEFLQKQYNLKRNTVNTEFKVIKSFMNKALTRGKHSNLSYKDPDFTPKEIETDEVMLNIPQLNELYNLDLSKTIHLERVRDLFILACWTGLRFSDATRIKPQYIVGNQIIIPMKKSGIKKTKVRIPIEHPHLKEVLKKYNYYSPSKLSNQKTNKYLKVICKKVASLNHLFIQENVTAGVNKTTESPIYQLISFHSARRTFCSNMYHIGVPTLSIMAISGHKTEKEFLRYIRVPDSDHAIRMADIQSRYFSRHIQRLAEIKSI